MVLFVESRLTKHRLVQKKLDRAGDVSYKSRCTASRQKEWGQANSSSCELPKEENNSAHNRQSYPDNG